MDAKRIAQYRIAGGDKRCFLRCEWPKPIRDGHLFERNYFWVASYPLDLHRASIHHEGLGIRRVAQNILEDLEWGQRMFVDPSDVGSASVEDVFG